jgi:hypothetical protein
VPPHSSTEKSPKLSTRTSSSYFSPNSAMAPDATAASCFMSRVSPAELRTNLLVHHALDLLQLALRHRLEVREVEAQAVGRDERALLRDVRAEHLAQGSMQQVRGRVIQHDRAAPPSSTRASTRAPCLNSPLVTRPMCANALPIF